MDIQTIFISCVDKLLDWFLGIQAEEELTWKKAKQRLCLSQKSAYVLLSLLREVESGFPAAQ